jgi:hypothetical protein
MQTVFSNSANRKEEEGFRASSRFVIFLLILNLNSCSPSDTPTKQQVKELVEGNLRRIGSPIKNFTIRDGQLGERSGATFYCYNWYGDFVWDYPKGVNTKVYGYVKFMKTNKGWKVDHMNYTEAARSSDTELKCE